ncbi:MAG: tRNA lysidine(34) synthetase TilS [Ruminococcaceae bacterium]|nr:tRNA lysidine(34) synthetase TilS [Oscillospiraceae bacterium]
MKKISICEEKFSRAVERYDMLSCESILVGLSGGADSVVLLHLLKKEAALRGFSLLALHVNHMIRGEEADRDEAFCRELCKKWEISFTSEKVDIPAIAKREKCGLEEAARNCRYKIFNNFCKENGIKRIATAHNSSDNLETVIFNIARGSSLKGVTGIPAVRENIIRPLIFCTKSEIIEYAAENRLEYVYDSTNSDTDYSRNLIRHKIVPELQKLNPSVEDAISRMTLLVRDDSDFIEKEAAKFSDSKTESLLSLEPAILRRVIKNMYSSYGGKGDLSYTHISDVISLISANIPHSRISLPGNISAAIENSSLVFISDLKNKERKNYKLRLSLGENVIEEDNSIIFICEEKDENSEEISKYLIKKQNIYKILIKATIAFDIMNFSLFVRNKEDGDKYVYGKMTRNIKKLFSEKKLPIEDRATIPIFESDGNILWIPGFPTADIVSPKINQTAPKFSIYYMKGLSQNEEIRY